MRAVRNGLRDLLGDLEDVADQAGQSLVNNIRRDLRELRDIVLEIIEDGDDLGWNLEEIVELTELVLEADGCVAELIAFLSVLLV